MGYNQEYVDAYVRHDGSSAKAAIELGVNERTIRKHVRRSKVDRPEDTKQSELTKQIVSFYEKIGGNISQTAKNVGVDAKTVRRHLDKAGIDRQATIIADGKINEPEYDVVKSPKKNDVKRFIITSAQNNTYIHEELWNNLLTYAKHMDAEIFVGTFSYNKSSFGVKAVKRGTKIETDTDELWYDHRIEEYIKDKRVLLSDSLFWCGEMNILPTQQNPMSGLNTYTGRKSSIFPHVKTEMRSVASAKHEPTKLMYTTGTITQRNYVQKKAGLKAESHHCYGALMVEIDSTGNWYVRQLLAEDDGSFQDLRNFVSGGKVEDRDVEAVTWGDVHALDIDTMIENMCWGESGILDTLKPKFQFFHDILLGAKTNHHERNNPHQQFKLHCTGWNSITKELVHTSEFLSYASREWCKNIVVDSNHDRPWIEKWLRETDYRTDPENAILFLELQLAMYHSILNNTSNFHVLEHAMKECFRVSDDIIFLREDESYTVCADEIECGMHGHLGPNGSRGTPASIKGIGKRANTAHTHTAGIYDGLYVAGTSTNLDMKFNSGPSSWTHSFIVTYASGKRTIVTMFDDKWKC